MGHYLKEKKGCLFGQPLLQKTIIMKLLFNQS